MAGRRLILPLIAAVLLAAPAGIARAQAPDDPPALHTQPDAKAKTGTGRKAVHRPARVDRVKRLNDLYDALAEAPNAELAKLIEARIEATRLQSGSATADLLMTRARISVVAKDNRVALELLDAIIRLAPDFIEARVQRANLYYQSKDIVQSLADLRVIVAKEPRHYGALTGLGVIFEELGEDKLALDAFRRALRADPFLESVPEMVKKLSIKVEGREI